MRTAVITVVRGRRAHLLRQHAGLSELVELPADYVVVAMGEPSLDDWRTASHPHPQVVALPCSAELLPLATARNIGALEAIAAGAELLIFLDVDCIPSPFMLTWYGAAAKNNPDALLSGAVGYLPPDADFSGDLDSIAHFHDFRPRLPIGSVDAADPRLFWSLSFAVTTGPTAGTAAKIPTSRCKPSAPESTWCGWVAPKRSTNTTTRATRPSSTLMTS
jgi:N-acetylglucosaminyl-diphospho-decaprenol L-rhamnosyltransferase